MSIRIINNNEGDKKGQNRELKIRIHKAPEIISRDSFFKNPELHSKYRYLLKIHIVPQKERKGTLKVLKVNETPESIKIKKDKDRIDELYETTVNSIAREIKQRIPNDKTEQLRAVFNCIVKRCKYWDDYPRGDGFLAKAETAEIRYGGNSLLAEDYNTKEVAILGGYSVCNGLAFAFKDIAQRLGIDCEVMQNKVHAWNMVYTDQGPRYIDCALAVEHFRGKNPILKQIKKRNYAPDDYFMVDAERLAELERMPGRICYPHGGGEISVDRKPRILDDTGEK